MPLDPSIWSAYVVSALIVISAIIYTIITEKQQRDEEAKNNG
ncbi:MAG: hypothetical protein ACTSRZ_05055 [Promethearchaeota archaeon]